MVQATSCPETCCKGTDAVAHGSRACICKVELFEFGRAEQAPEKMGLVFLLQ